MPLFTAFFATFLLYFACSRADQTVFLDRPVLSTVWEPRFNPSVITASIGEQIHFVARFGELYGFPLGESAVVNNLILHFHV